eukprot:TRINITY_DN34553_c0_g1_i2.p1 TRINITY_DN34553_c0_g1~~TRINITY_DN34553_c0_g1_i2.p1  ORF type:complete len:201 (+),score=43.68 TRINITY_DN34553_c0_g1_i2:44-646(+)
MGLAASAPCDACVKADPVVAEADGDEPMAAKSRTRPDTDDEVRDDLQNTEAKRIISDDFEKPTVTSRDISASLAEPAAEASGGWQEDQALLVEVVNTPVLEVDFFQDNRPLKIEFTKLLGMTLEEQLPLSVKRVPADSHAELMGVKPGMVISRVGGTDLSRLSLVEATDEFRRRLVEHNLACQQSDKILKARFGQPTVRV